jgi:hypothetical protein
LAGVADDRELAGPVVSVPDADAPELCEDLLREALTGGRRSGQPLKDAHMR